MSTVIIPPPPLTSPSPHSTAAPAQCHSLSSYLPTHPITQVNMDPAPGPSTTSPQPVTCRQHLSPQPTEETWLTGGSKVPVGRHGHYFTGTQRPPPSPPLTLLPGKQTQPTGFIYPDMGSLSILDRNLSAEPRCSGVSSGCVENLLTEKRQLVRNTLDPRLHPTAHGLEHTGHSENGQCTHWDPKPGYHTLLGHTEANLQDTVHMTPRTSRSQTLRSGKYLL